MYIILQMTSQHAQRTLSNATGSTHCVPTEGAALPTLSLFYHVLPSMLASLSRTALHVSRVWPPADSWWQQQSVFTRRFALWTKSLTNNAVSHRRVPWCHDYLSSLSHLSHGHDPQPNDPLPPNDKITTTKQNCLRSFLYLSMNFFLIKCGTKAAAHGSQFN